MTPMLEMDDDDLVNFYEYQNFASEYVDDFEYEDFLVNCVDHLLPFDW